MVAPNIPKNKEIIGVYIPVHSSQLEYHGGKKSYNPIKDFYFLRWFKKHICIFFFLLLLPQNVVSNKIAVLNDTNEKQIKVIGKSSCLVNKNCWTNSIFF